MSKQTVKARVFRYNPDTDPYPSYQTYEVPWDEKGNALQLLKQIYWDIDHTLAFPYYACGYKFCNNCLMTINEKPTHACFTLVNPGEEVVFEPMRGYPVIRDLVVDFGRKVTTPDGKVFEISKGAVIKEIEAKPAS
jgi:succinate dehydrogenase/fumarate reductase-like Fe-S protein